MLALVAGQGALPQGLAARLKAQGQPFIVCALEGFPPDLPDVLTFRIEHLGSLLQRLRDLGCDRVCLAGAVRRPAIDPAAIDAKTAPLVPRLMQALPQGDDATLRAILALFEEAGLRVVSASEIAPDLLPPAGILTRAQPTEQDRTDADRAARAHADMAAADIGQALVVAQGQVLAVEAAPGTDWMLRSLTVEAPTPRPVPHADSIFDPIGLATDFLAGPSQPAARPRRRDPALTQQRGVLFKAPKQGQDRRVDLPAIGPQTVVGAAQAGLAGIVVEAGGTLILDLPAVVSAADAAGLFLWVRG